MFLLHSKVDFLRRIFSLFAEHRSLLMSWKHDDNLTPQCVGSPWINWDISELSALIEMGKPPLIE